MEIAAPFHVLLIEDSPDDRADIRQMLLRGSQRRYTFSEAETGSAALRALHEMANPPDCILLDFNLPDMTALEILAEMHAGKPLPGCPVVVLTGVAECGPHVIGAGAQDFVGKSWASPESLTRAIENAVERYALTREHQKAYEALCTSEQRLDLGLRVAGVGLAEVDYTTGVNHLSAESARQFGLGASAVAVTRERVHATFHPDDRAELATRIAESLDPDGAGWFAMDHRVIWPSGEVRWLRVRKQVTFAGEGRARRPARAVLATVDITTEKRAEERLRLFEQVVNGIRDAVIITEAEPINEPGPSIVYVNPAFTEMTGYTAAEAIGRSSHLLQGPKSSRSALEKIRAAQENCQPVTVEVTNYRKDGTEFEVEFSIMPVANEHGCFTHWVSLQRDVSERNRVAEALAQNAALFAKIIEQAPGGVYVMDAQLRVREVNAEALPIFANIQPVIGREIGEVMETLWGPELGQECTAIIRHTLETGGRYISPRFDHQRQDIGVAQAYEWETQRLTLPDGQHGVVCYFQDVTTRERAAAALRTEVTDRKQAEEQLSQLNADLEQRVAERTAQLEAKAAEMALTSRYKSEFLTNMSHELRTPLNPIILLSQQLTENRAGNLTRKQVEYSQHIHSSGTELLTLISDILDLSKIESGTVSIEVEEIPFAELHSTIERNCRYIAEAKNLPCHVTFAPDLPPAMVSDPRRLHQILKNLLSNAIKFTALGKVEVNVDVATQGWTPDHLVLSKSPQVIAFAVTDTGIGIAPEKQRLIFEAFQQTDASTARKYGGTGLGLAISRELATLLGGEIKLSSILGQGSTFTLYLPLHHTGPNNVCTVPTTVPLAWKLIGTPPPPVPDAALRGRKVLVVDDDARNIFALTAALEEHEMEVIAATNGRTAIDFIHQTPNIALVLMDIMMPEMDGYETIREIRSAPEFRTLPILALTAKAMKGDREKCLDAGASDYIAKPVNTDQLLSLMRVWLFR